MPGNKITEFFSEYNIKGDAVDKLKKIEREEKKLTKSLKNQNKVFDKNQKETKQSTAELKKLTRETKRAASETRKFDRIRSKFVGVGKRAGAGATGGLGGGGTFQNIGKIGTAIPILGAVILAAAAAIARAEKAITGVAQEKRRRAGGRVFAPGDKTEVAGQKFTGNLNQQLEAIAEIGRFAGRKGGLEEVTGRDVASINKLAKQLGVSSAEAIQQTISGEAFKAFEKGGLLGEEIAKSIGESNRIERQFKLRTVLDELAKVQELNKKTVDEQVKANQGAVAAQNSLERISSNRAKADSEYIKGLKDTGTTAEQLVQTGINADVAISKVSAGLVGSVSGIIKTVIDSKDAIKKTILGGAGAAIDSAALKKELDKQGKEVGFFGNVRAKKRAHGGAVDAGKPFTVGERGPETFVPGKAGRIMPNKKTSAINMGNVIFNISGVTDPEAVAQIMQRKFSEMIDKFADTTMARQLNINEGLG